MPKVKSSIPKVPNAIRAAAGELVKRAAESHVSVSKQLAPVKTGFLRDNVKAEQVSTLTWNVISGAPYSVHVEFDQPFFLPGYESAQRQLRSEAQAVVAAELVKITIRT